MAIVGRAGIVIAVLILAAFLALCGEGLCGACLHAYCSQADSTRRSSSALRKAVAHIASVAARGAEGLNRGDAHGTLHLLPSLEHRLATAISPLRI